MDNMAFKIVDTLHVIALGPRNPSTADWNSYVEALHAEEKKGVDVAQMRTIVFSDGGGPEPAMRKQVVDLLHGRTTKLAVVTGSTTLRAVMTAMSWFNRDARAFAPAEVGDALRHLGVAETKFDSIKAMAQGLLKDLGLKQVNALEQASLKVARAHP